MRKEKVVKIGEREFLVKEKTVGEIMAEAEEQQTKAADAGVSLVRAAILPTCNLHDVAWMCDVDVGELDSFAPSELETLAGVCVEVNSHFFALANHVIEATKTA